MDTVKTIKNIDDETWYKLKGLSVKNRTTIGRLLKKMINEYEQKSKNSWDKIMSYKGTLTDKQAEELLQNIKKERKEFGFRKWA